MQKTVTCFLIITAIFVNLSLKGFRGNALKVGKFKLKTLRDRAVVGVGKYYNFLFINLIKVVWFRFIIYRVKFLPSKTLVLSSSDKHK